MDFIPVSKFFIQIFIYGILAFFFNAIELALPAIFGLDASDQWISWALVIVTDVSAMVVILACAIRLIMVGQKRSVYNP